MTYRIKNMVLQNFCGIKHLEISPNGYNVSVFGDNATGKSTIANAFSWLFTGKNAAGTAELDPVPLDGSNGKIHNLETSVTVAFEDGSEYRRTLSEVWAKKRGEADEKLTGTKTTYYRDSVPLKEKEFLADCEQLFGSAESFRMLTIGGYFPNVMDWKARRKTLIEVCGDVSDEDVLAANPQLAELGEILGNHTVDDYLKIVKAKKADLKKEIDLIPARITENRDALGDGAEIDIESTKDEIRQFEAKEKDLTERLAALSAEDPSVARKRELRAQLEEARAAFLTETNSARASFDADIQRLTSRKAALFAERSPMLVRLAELPKKIERMKSRREELIRKTAEVRAKQYDGGENCPCCGQKLPAEQFDKAIAEFNRRKSEELEKISEEARTTCHRDMIAAAEKELSDLTVAVRDKTELYAAVDAELAERSSWGESKRLFEDTAEYKEITAQINAVAITDNKAERDELAEVRNRLSAAREKLAQARAAENIQKRIAELEEQQKALASEYALCEKGEYLCGLFIRTKVSMLDERINSRFRTLKFKLFHEQQNGGLQETCKVLIPCESGLVEYDKANNAARINAGLEIISALSEHYGITLPVFVDNAESVTAFYNINNQVIKLIVSEADKQLRFEIDESLYKF